MTLSYLSPTPSPEWDAAIGQVAPPPPMPIEPDGEPEASEEQLQGTLGKALALRGLRTTDSYVIKDESGRVLCLDIRGNGTWGWAYMGQHGPYIADVMPVTLQLIGRSGNKFSLSVQVDGRNWPLFVNGDSKTREWVFFAPGRWPRHPQPLLMARPQPEEGNATVPRFSFYWDHDGVPMYLQAGEGEWNWLALDHAARSIFTLHRYYVTRDALPLLIRSTWPSAKLLHKSLQIDDAYEAVSTAQAKAIWFNSELPKLDWKPNVFDCDDFALVYKAQACISANAGGGVHPYAVGILFGSAERSAHAVNLFIDPAGKLMVIEPQTGQVIDAKNWEYSPDFLIM